LGRGHESDAYTLVTLLVLVTVLNVLVAAALPLWSQQIQREKEEELIFRGLQYAEAIRLFQTQFGRYPLQLEELLELEPRHIRQLWKDPMTEDGRWGLIFAQGTPTGEGGRGGQPGIVDSALQQGNDLTGSAMTTGTAQPGLSDNFGNRDRRDRRNRRDEGRDDDIVTTGPILGVHSRSDETAIKRFLDGDKYSSWLFTPDIIPIAPTAPGEIVPSLNSKWIGRPFPQGFEPTGGTGIDDTFGDDDRQVEEDNQRQRRRRRSGG
jgi:type II secretory pathway pseudopilin PulG